MINSIRQAGPQVEKKNLEARHVPEALQEIWPAFTTLMEDSGSWHTLALHSDRCFQHTTQHLPHYQQSHLPPSLCVQRHFGMRRDWVELLSGTGHRWQLHIVLKKTQWAAGHAWLYLTWMVDVYLHCLRLRCRGLILSPKLWCHNPVSRY